MPIIKILRPGHEAALETFLLPRVDTSMFLIGNLRQVGFEDEGQFYQGTYAAAFEDDEIIGVIGHYWGHNLVLQAPLDLLEPLLRAVVAASQRSIQGLLGPNEQVATLKQILDIEAANILMDEEENLYSLPLDDLIEPESLRRGKLRGRRIEPADLDLITEWRVSYSIEVLGQQDGPELWERCRSGMERSQQEGRTWLLEDEGRPVACTSFNTTIKEAVQVGGVWTPPEYRRRGYGRAVVAVSLLDARAEGAHKAILFTGEGNLPAQKAYIALGFRHIGDYRILLLDAPIERF